MIVGFFIIIIFLNADSDSILSTTLMETRDQEGLNYLVVVKDSDQDQGSINSEELSSVWFPLFEDRTESSTKDDVSQRKYSALYHAYSNVTTRECHKVLNDV